MPWSRTWSPEPWKEKCRWIARYLNRPTQQFSVQAEKEQPEGGLMSNSDGIRWQQRLENFQKALSQLGKALNYDLDPWFVALLKLQVLNIDLVQRFYKLFEIPAQHHISMNCIHFGSALTHRASLHMIWTAKKKNQWAAHRYDIF